MQATLRTKGVILDSFLEDRLVMEASAKPDVRALAEELLPIKRRLAQLTLRTPKDPRSEVLSRRSEMRWHLEHKADELEIDLTHKVPGIDKARRAIDISPEEVQGAIPKDAALIEFFRYFHYLGIDAAELRYGAVILPSSGEPKWVCLGPVKPIDQNIWLAHACVHAATNENALAKCLGDLYRQVWAPVTPLLPDGLKIIIISPDAGLNFLPFATLLTPEDRFLAENYSLRYVSSGRDLLATSKSSTNLDLVLFLVLSFLQMRPLLLAPRTRN